jgi:hypothetical protein
LLERLVSLGEYDRPMLVITALCCRRADPPVSSPRIPSAAGEPSAGHRRMISI